MASLDTPIESVPKVKKTIVPALKHLGIKTIRDLLFHFPARYEDFSNVKTVDEIVPNEIVTVQGTVERITMRRTSRKGLVIVEATIQDETGKIKSVWFNQPYLARNLKQGDPVRMSGKVVEKNGIHLQNPSYEKISGLSTNYSLPTTNVLGIHTGGLVPLYPETHGISSRWLRFLIHLFLPLRKDLADPLPEELRKRHHLLEIREAVRCIHAPERHEEAEEAQRRFHFESLLMLSLQTLKTRMRIQKERAHQIHVDIDLIKQFVRSLPFTLTDAQRRSLWEIVQDMGKPHPMNRLLEGDVGSGKTVVAAAASLLAVRAGYRVAFMAPTEILADQHFATFANVLKPFRVEIGILTGSKKQAGAFEDIIVGTHALLQKNTGLKNIALVIVDEQHRFGVSQRKALATRTDTDNTRTTTDKTETHKGTLQVSVSSPHGFVSVPHFLSMSATPIPRTLALTVYGDLDLSVLDEMPKSRKPVITRVVEPKGRSEAYQCIRDEVRRDRQVFVICPRIELRSKNDELRMAYQSRTFPSGKVRDQKLLLADAKTVKDEYKKLSEHIFPDLRIGMLHGKLKPKEKETIMSSFKNHNLDILVSTSVIEVGIDIPNATVMMIEGAERFGLAQLHQFRGRVGRGSDQSYCFLFTTEGGTPTRRLRAMTKYQDGFKLAEEDLKIRGAGEMFGTRQSGISDSMLAALADPKLVHGAREEAATLLKNDPELTRYPTLKAKLEEMEKRVHLE